MFIGLRNLRGREENAMNRNLIEILVSVFMGAIGQTVLKLGANKLDNLSLSFRTIFKDIIHILMVPEILVGLVLLGAAFCCGSRF